VPIVEAQGNKTQGVEKGNVPLDTPFARGANRLGEEGWKGGTHKINRRGRWLGRKLKFPRAKGNETRGLENIWQERIANRESVGTLRDHGARIAEKRGLKKGGDEKFGEKGSHFYENFPSFET